jgi:hypothetical protein
MTGRRRSTAPKPRRFRAEILTGHKGDAVLVPFDPAAEWDLDTVEVELPWRTGWPVQGTLAGAKFRGWVGRRWGRFFLLVDAALQRAAGVKAGDEVDVVLRPQRGQAD